ncbi:SRPBCC family protein [Noviherbaspirillum pedocola]|uniref:SRPBCC family protein n=1 Tax=Noviherbaspirillum pedocola TaxID=2801341 RepID=A0A934SPU8_9BURK|nr:SRPBCC family protein [Noviherbaspirillum pedocola]MBK4734521.1 SRPBCC family protein [Noviherbaspirillum pedocola]
MARISQSVEIKAPVHVAYNQLTQFEDYPRFMEEVESARQTDDTHVHWTTRAGGASHDWDSEIVEQQPDRCIAWRNTGGPVSTGRMEVEQTGADASRVTFTIEAAVDGAAQGAEQALAQQIGSDLQRLKQMLESSGGDIQGNSAGTGEATEYGTARVEGGSANPGASAEGYGDSRLTNTQGGK